MEIKKGIGVSPGVVISTAVVLDAEDLLIPRRQIPADDVSQEITRLDNAIIKCTQDLVELRNSITAQHGKEIGKIFDVHLGLLYDKSMMRSIAAEIENNHTTAEYAVSVVMRKYAQSFLNMKDVYFAERVKDVYDIERRLLRQLIGAK